MSQPRSLRYRFLASLILGAVLITGTTGLASNHAAAADPKADKEDVTWHDKPLPGPLETVMQDTKNADTTLAAFKGKVLVVNFWATWCAPCIKEMPTLDALQKKLGGKDFQVLAVSQDREGLRVAQPFMEKNEWTNVGLYVEPKSRFARDAKLRGLPTTIVLDRQGQEVGRLEGTIDWTAPKVVQKLEKLIAQK